MYAEKSMEEQGLLWRTRSISGCSSSSGDEEGAWEVELDELEGAPCSRHTRWWTRRRRRRHNSKVFKASHVDTPRHWGKRSAFSRLWRLLVRMLYAILGLVLVVAVFLPSYSTPPQRYLDLQRRVQQSTAVGSANPNNEKVFIAASLYDEDGSLLAGPWGRSVLELVGILGPNNVFLSIYENDPSNSSMLALEMLERQLPCEHAMVHEHLNLEELTHVTALDGSRRLKRIAFLAEVRNRALRPLEDFHSHAHHTRFDKLLYLNDIAFHAVDAANLLFNTNADDTTGRTSYRAACAVDFINPFKFYDTFATRDLEGHSMGVPFYPWFTNAGEGRSRKDVLRQTDAVRVKSCWGGMVAFEAKWFQPHLYDVQNGDLVVPSMAGGPDDAVEAATAGVLPSDAPVSNKPIQDLTWQAAYGSSASRFADLHRRSSSTPSTSTVTPLRFRSELDTYWDASECCLIHADLAQIAPALPPAAAATAPPSSTAADSTGIYMNPYIRVAYSPSVLAWLPLTRRIERLYSPIHTLANAIAHLPFDNPRRQEQPGDEVIDRVWQWDSASLERIQNGNGNSLSSRATLHGAYQQSRRVARAGQFCGTRNLMYLREDHAGYGGAAAGALWDADEVPRFG